MARFKSFLRREVSPGRFFLMALAWALLAIGVLIVITDSPANAPTPTSWPSGDGDTVRVLP